MIYQKHIPIEEAGDAFPQYMVGDIFISHDGSYGIITETSKSTSGWPPSYSAARIKGYYLDKNAWWRANEWKEVLLGPLHYILNDFPDGYAGPRLDIPLSLGS